MKKYRKIIISIVTLSIFNGCGSTNAYNINYTQNIEEMNIYSTNSINIVLEKMVASLLQTLPVDKTNRPVIVLGTVNNNTMEYIDTRNITNKIKISLLKSGLVRISLYDNDTSEIRDYKLYGDINSIEKKDGKKIDICYKITLNLVNIKSGLIVWVDEEEISIIKKFQ